MLGPFSEVDMTYNVLLGTSVEGSEDLISSRVGGLDVWVYGGIEYSTCCSWNHKMARTAWALLARSGPYQKDHVREKAA